MTQEAKSRKTPRQRDIIRTRRRRGDELFSWMQDCLQVAKERLRKAAETTEPRPPRTGMTARMRNIPGPRRQVLHGHQGPNSQQRRHFATDGGGVGTWPKDLRSPAVNVPYVNPARDEKKARNAARRARRRRTGARR